MAEINDPFKQSASGIVDPFKAAPAATQSAPESASVRLSDYGRQALGGAISAAGYGIRGIAEGAALPGPVRGTPATRLISRGAGAIMDAGEAIAGGISQTAAERLAGSQPGGELLRPSTWTLGDDPSFSGYGLQAANVLGQAAPMLATGAITRGRMAPTAGVGMAVSGGAAAEEEGGRIRAMGLPDLQKLPGYQERIAAGMSEGEARADLEASASRGAFVAAAPLGAADALTHVLPFTRGAQAALGNVVGNSRVRRAAAGVVLGGLGEGVQEVAEGVAARTGADLVTGDPRNVFEDTFGEFALGAIGGGAIGGAAGLATPNRPAADRLADTGGDQQQEPGAPAAPAAPAAPVTVQSTIVDPADGPLSRAVAEEAAAQSGAAAVEPVEVVTQLADQQQLQEAQRQQQKEPAQNPSGIPSGSESVSRQTDPVPDGPAATPTAPVQNEIPSWIDPETGEDMRPRGTREQIDAELAARAGQIIDATAMRGIASKLNVRVREVALARQAMRAAEREQQQTPAASAAPTEEASNAQSQEAERGTDAVGRADAAPVEQPPAAAEVDAVEEIGAQQAPAAVEGRSDEEGSAVESQAPVRALTYDESGEALDTDIEPPSGGSFTVRGAADAVARRTPDARVIALDDGTFAVRTPTEANPDAIQSVEPPAPAAAVDGTGADAGAGGSSVVGDARAAEVPADAAPAAPSGADAGLSGVAVPDSAGTGATVEENQQRVEGQGTDRNSSVPQPAPVAGDAAAADAGAAAVEGQAGVPAGNGRGGVRDPDGRVEPATAAKAGTGSDAGNQRNAARSQGVVARADALKELRDAGMSAAAAARAYRAMDKTHNGANLAPGRVSRAALDAAKAKPADPAPATTKAPDPAVEQEYRLHGVRIMEQLTDAERSAVYTEANKRSPGGFEGLPADEKAAAYGRYVAAGGRRPAVPSDYNAMVRQKETEADLRRRQSPNGRDIAPASGGSYKTEAAARAAIAKFPEAGDFARALFGVAQIPDGFVVRRLSSEAGGRGALGSRWVSADVPRAEAVQDGRDPDSPPPKARAARKKSAKKTETVAESDAYTGPGQLTFDNPGGAWEAEQQRIAEQRRRDSGLATAQAMIDGKTTAWARGMSMPTNTLAVIPGASAEARVPGDAQFDALMRAVRAEGFRNDSPILVHVNHLGEPYIVEGNTRVAVADALGIESVPVEIRWMNGGEKVQGRLTPDVLREQAVEVAPTTAPIGSVEAPVETVVQNGDGVDAGEELSYNRRNLTGKNLTWDDIADQNATLRAKQTVKSKVWPRPDYEKLVQDGMHPLTARLVKGVYDALAAKPKRTDDASLQAYIAGMGKVRDAVMAWAPTVDMDAVLSSIAGASDIISYSRAGDSIAQAMKSEQLVDSIFPANGEPRNRYRNTEQGRANNDLFNAVSNARRLNDALRPGTSAMRDAAKAVREGWPAPQESWEKSYTIHATPSGTPIIERGVQRTTTTDEYFITRKGRRSIEGGPFTSRDAAVIAARDLASGRRKKGGNMAEEAVELRKAVRDGAPRRAPGENVTSERIAQTFGIRGVNFGNWMKGDSRALNEERQLHLNHAYDALTDLAEVMGIPADAIGLNGMLGIAFGAQGHGSQKAAAHFVPGVNEINLTRRTGVGALAHEWGHALDHYFAVQAGEQLARSRTPFLTEFTGPNERIPGVRPEIAQAFRDIVAAMTRRPETDAERVSREKSLEARETKRLDSWLTHISKGIERAPDAVRGDLRAMANQLFDRLRAGDMGEGYVNLGKSRKNLVHPVVEQIRTTFAEAGIKLAPDDLMSVEANANMIRIGNEQSRGERTPRGPMTRPTSFVENAKALDSEAGGQAYFNTNLELFARAFQSYVLDRLAQRGIRSDYLTRPQGSAESVGKMVEMKLLAGDRYPRGVEREAMNTAFDKLVAEIRTRTSDDGRVGLYSRPEPSRPAADANYMVPPDELRRHVTRIVGKWQGDVPLIRVLDSASELPAFARRESGWEQAEGFYDGTGTVYLVATNIANMTRAEQVLAHEAFGHYGVDGVVGRQQWTQIVGDVARLRRDPSSMKADMQAAMASAERRYGGQNSATFAREFLAVMAERGVRSSFLGRVMSAVRGWLRGLGFDVAKWADASMREVVAKGMRQVRDRGAQRADSGRGGAMSAANPTFYSAMTEAVAEAKGAPRKASAEQWGQWLDGAARRGEFKQEERLWSGVDDWMRGQTNITRDQLLDYVRANEVQIEETVLGELSESDIRARMEQEGAGVRAGENGKWIASFNGSDLPLDFYSEQAAMREIETMLRDQAGDTSPKFANYTLPGGQNYRELLLRMPERAPVNAGWRVTGALPNNFTTREDAQEYIDRVMAMIDDPGMAAIKPSLEKYPLAISEVTKDGGNFLNRNHFDQANILAHVRFNERTDASGARVLFLEEVQSDWHQAGRRDGYQGQNVVDTEGWKAVKRGSRYSIEDAQGRFVNELRADSEADAIAQAAAASRAAGVPNAPFKTTWPMLAMKRMIRYAVDNGFDRIAWTTGSQQAERYDLSKQVSTIDYMPSTGRLFVRGTDGALIYNQVTDASNIPDVIGKEAAEKLLSQPMIAIGGTTGANWQRLEGDGLRVGGEGMKAFYDRMLPAEVNKLAKRYGARVGDTTITTQGTETAPAHVLDITDGMRTVAREGLPMFSRPDTLLQTIGSAMRDGDDGLMARLRGKVEDFKPSLLGALTLRQLAEVSERYLPAGRSYVDSQTEMAARRNLLQQEVGDLSQQWEAMQARDRRKATAQQKKDRDTDSDRTVDVMHDATIAGTDPAEAYVVSMLRLNYNGDAVPLDKASGEAAVARLTAMLDDRNWRKSAGEATIKTVQSDRARVKAGMVTEQERAQAYPKLVRQFNRLPAEWQQLYRDVRDSYAKRADQMLDALVARVEALEIDGKQKAALTQRLRTNFESARVEAPYFPLARFGDFWGALEQTDSDGNTIKQFVMGETQRERDRALRAAEAAGWKVTGKGKKIENVRSQDGTSGTFVAEVIDSLRGHGVQEKALDEVYQLYLRTLPDLSTRKHFIHRKKIAGYDQDALRAFSGHMFHGAHQLSKIEFQPRLERDIEALVKQAQALQNSASEDADRASAGVNEFKKRHEWVLNPTSAKWAQQLSSLNFVFYLGLTPAAAAVNLSQTAITTYPVLASRYGAMKALQMTTAAVAQAASRAVKDTAGALAAFKAGKAYDQDSTLGLVARTPDERRAYADLLAMGAIDVTQSHDLAGLGDTDTRDYNPTVHRAMNVISYLFHKAEVINREASGLANYRMAREAGKTHEVAVKEAAETIWLTHFDYSNANRARFMQGNTAKVLLAFRQYSQSMSFFLWRSFYLSMKGESPEVKREARNRLIGALGMTGVFAGVMGMPLMSLMFGVANAAHAAFGDDDDPWDAEIEFRNFLVDMFGQKLGRIVDEGLIEGGLAAVGISPPEIGSRVSLNDLWIREPDKDLEGKDLYMHLLEQVAGPIAGMFGGAVTGAGMISEGLDVGNPEMAWRGVEKMMPKVVRDGMKAMRYQVQGITNMRGDPLMADSGVLESVYQGMGFMPADVSRQYEINAAAKMYEGRINERKQRLLNAYALAVKQGDTEAARETIQKISAFNKAHPTIAINANSIRRSLQSRQRYSERAVNGVVIGARLDSEVRGRVRFGQGESE